LTEKKRKRRTKRRVKISKSEGATRLIIAGKPVVGLNSHGMYEHEKTLHIHLGRLYKIVLRPKDLIGLWKRKGKKYVRVAPKDRKKRKRRRKES